jgi:hypothetical protein
MSAFAQDSAQGQNEVTAQDLAKVQGQISQLKTSLVKQSAVQHEQAAAMKSQLTSTNEKISGLKINLDDFKKNTNASIDQLEDRFHFWILLLAGVFTCLFLGQWLVKAMQSPLSKAKSQPASSAVKASEVNQETSYPQNMGSLLRDLPPAILTPAPLDATMDVVKLGQPEDSGAGIGKLITQELDQTQHAFEVARKGFMSSPNVS